MSLATGLGEISLCCFLSLAIRVFFVSLAPVEISIPRCRDTRSAVLFFYSASACVFHGAVSTLSRGEEDIGAL